MSELSPHNPSNLAKIYVDKYGREWVANAELWQCGYERPNDFDVVYLNGKYYELQGYVKSAKAWWIEEIPIQEEGTGE